MSASISTAQAPAAVGPYAQAVSTGTHAGATVYISGQIPLDAATGEMLTADIAAQTRCVLQNLGKILAAADLSYADVVKTTILLTNMDDFAAVNEVYAQFFTGAVLPARSAFQVVALPKGAQIEIEAIALRP